MYCSVKETSVPFSFVEGLFFPPPCTYPYFFPIIGGGPLHFFYRPFLKRPGIVAKRICSDLQGQTLLMTERLPNFLSASLS